MEPPQHELEHQLEGGDQANPRPTLANLPTEIFLLILSRFCAHCRHAHSRTPIYIYREFDGQRSSKPSWYSQDRQTLHSFCLVSRRFRDIGQAVLYHEFCPGYGDSWLSTSFDWNRRLAPFLRTVALRPDLARRVRKLHIRLSLLFSFVDEDQPALEKASRARNICLPDFLAPFQDHWRQDEDNLFNGPYKPSISELVSMLLVCLPNIAHLTFLDHPLPRGIPAAALRAGGISSLPIWAIEVCGGLDSLGTGIFEMASSTLRVLNLDLCTRAAWIDIVSHLHGLRRLCLTKCIFGVSQLEPLLSRCEGLRSLIYETGEEFFNNKFSPGHSSTAGVVAQLLKNKATLKTLYLDLRDAHYQLYEDKLFVTELLPSLSRFPALQHVLLTSAPLYRQKFERESCASITLAEALPRSLVTLRLIDDTMDPGILALLSEDVRKLATSTAQGQFPQLEKVSVDTKDPISDDANVRPLFASVGVIFKYTAYRLSNGSTKRRQDLPVPDTEGETAVE